MEPIKLVEPAVILAFLNFANKPSLVKARLSLPRRFRTANVVCGAPNLPLPAALLHQRVVPSA